VEAGQAVGELRAINGAPEARRQTRASIATPLVWCRASGALIFPGSLTHGSKPAALHRGLTFGDRAYGPQILVRLAGTREGAPHPITLLNPEAHLRVSPLVLGRNL
jgi:hypothetical protein